MNRVETASRLQALPSAALRGRIEVPGDKSISHRALILGALADGETIIEGLLESRDVLDTAEALRALGARIDRRDGIWHVEGTEWRSPAGTIDCGNSGTGVRLLMGAAAGFPIEATFTGDQSLRRRPMKRVLDPLRRMGARFDGGDRLPITLRGGLLSGTSHLSEHASAQVKSAILLAGLRAEDPIEVIEPIPSRDHTERMLSTFGCDVETVPHATGRIVRLGIRRALRATYVPVPGDPSSAAFPLVAALLVPNSEVTVSGMLLNPLRTGFVATLREMGGDLSVANRRLVGGEEVGDVTARSSTLEGIEVPASRAPSMIDEYPILAVAAAFARGTTMLHGLAELRVKESDRLEVVLAGLRACGVNAAIAGDTLEIRGVGEPPPGGNEISTHADHRIAMSFLILGLGSRDPVGVDRAEMIGTSFPGFADLMGSLGARICAPAVAA